MKTIIKYLPIFAILLAIFSFSSSVSAQIKNEILIVADQKADCTGVAATNCLQVKRLNEEKFALFYQNIENFTFIAGYFYVLDVRVDTLKNMPADGSKYKYRLNRILARVKSEDLPTPTTALSLYGTDWALTKIGSQAVENSNAHIKFDERNKKVNGNGGCNSFGGSLEISGNQIKLSKIFSTKMFCQSAQDVENKFFANLEKVDKFNIRSGKLYLSAGEEILLEFAPKK